jgi:hypothetical protein
MQKAPTKQDHQARLKEFDKATERQRQREAGLDQAQLAAAASEGRGWTRTDLYDRGGAR